MITQWYRPFSLFSGFVGSNQNNIFEIITPNSSSVYHGLYSHIPHFAFNYSDSRSAATSGLDPGCRCISFTLINSSFYITHYEIKQRPDSFDNYLKKWSFYGSKDNENWELLDTSEGDNDFLNPGKTKLIKCHNGAFQHFRLQELEDVLLVVNQIEIYGFWCNTKEQCLLSWIFHKTNKIHPQLFYSPLFFLFTSIVC